MTWRGIKSSILLPFLLTLCVANLQFVLTSANKEQDVGILFDGENVELSKPFVERAVKSTAASHFARLSFSEVRRLVSDDAIYCPYPKKGKDKGVDSAKMNIAVEDPLYHENVRGGDADCTKVKNAKKMKRVFSNDAKYCPYHEEGEDKGVDDAIFIEDEGMCFVAFQSTTLLFKDIAQNLNLFNDKVCKGEGGKCCNFRQGYKNGWTTRYKDRLLNHIRSCVKRCEKDKDRKAPCLVITGHSQGGAIAAAASVEISSVTSNYEVVTFGAPDSLATKREKCEVIESAKHYRFGKGIYKNDKKKFFYDNVSFLKPSILLPWKKTYAVGHFIVLSHDTCGDSAAYVGFDTNVKLKPWDNDEFIGDAHDLYTATDSRYPNAGYFNILKKMLKSSEPVSATGFENGRHCGNVGNEWSVCASGRCAKENPDPTCQAKLENSVKCKSDRDCKSGRCHSSTECKDGEKKCCIDKEKNKEKCKSDRDCKSGRCHTSRYCKDGDKKCCKDKKENNVQCESDRDCKSGRCSNKWCKSGHCSGKRCVGMIRNGEECQRDIDCISGKCHRNQCIPSASDRECKASTCKPKKKKTAFNDISEL